jgi:hypothetical protein
LIHLFLLPSSPSSIQTKNHLRGNQLSNRQKKKVKINPKEKPYELTPARMTGGGWMLMENQCMAVKVDGCIHVFMAMTTRMTD